MVQTVSISEFKAKRFTLVNLVKKDRAAGPGSAACGGGDIAGDLICPAIDEDEREGLSD